MPFGWGQTREVTVVNDETERGIPLRTYWNCIGVSALDIVLFVLSLFMVCRQVYNWMYPPGVNWYNFPWISSAVSALLMWWPSVVALICWAAIAWSYPLLYRFFVETFGKNAQPIVDKWDPRDGMWSPWARPSKPDKPAMPKPRYLIFNGKEGEE